MTPKLPLILYNTTRNCVVGDAVSVAASPWKRLRGLLCRPELPPGNGLLLLPSRGIHTFCMRHAIDVVFLDSRLRVLRVCNAVGPWQVRLAVKNTHCVVELRKHEASNTGLAAGDQLQLQDENGIFGLAELPERTPAEPAAGQRSARWLLLALLLTVQAGLVWSAHRPAMAGRVDLRAYYAAGTAAHLYGPASLYNDAVEQHTQQILFHDGWRTLHFLYPPFAVLPYQALARLPYGEALALVSLGSLLCLFVAAVLLYREHPQSAVSPVLLSLCALCAFPSVVALTQGQLSFVLLLLLTAFYCLERRGMHLLAGLCLALGMVKVQVVLPVAVLYLLWRRYRVVAGFAMGTALLGVLSLSITGMAGLHGYAARLHQVGAVTLHDGAAALVQFGVHTASEPNLHGVALLLAGDGTYSALLTLLLSIAVLLWSARQAASVSTAVCAALLLSYHLLPYDLVLLLLPFALVALRLLPHLGSAQGAVGYQQSTTMWLLTGSALLLSAPVAAVLMLHNAMTWYVLATVALLFVSGGSNGRHKTTTPARAAALASQQVQLPA